MSSQTQLRLAKSSWGRMCLHLMCFMRDRRIKSHFKGIFREVKLICLL